MRLLLDTQMFIWHALKHTSLKTETRLLMDDPANSIFLSHISLFEIVIKQKIGKLPQFQLPTVQIIELAALRFTLLPIYICPHRGLRPHSALAGTSRPV